MGGDPPGRQTASRPAQPRCSVSRPVRNSRWPWGCAIPTSSARSWAATAWGGVPAGRRAAGPVSAYLPRGRHRGTVFLSKANRWAEALRQAGGDVVMAQRVG